LTDESEGDLMSLEQLFQSVESGLFNLGRNLCRDRHAEAREEAEGVGEKLRRERGALRNCRDEMAQLRQRVRAAEERAALLASRVESFLYVHDGSSAYDHALELDHIRRRIADDRDGLRRALRFERECLDAIRDLEKRYDDLQDKLSRR
jgi:predicted  nucleic acid-binding Zn-ribbon protein